MYVAISATTIKASEDRITIFVLCPILNTIHLYSLLLRCKIRYFYCNLFIFLKEIENQLKDKPELNQKMLRV